MSSGDALSQEELDQLIRLARRVLYAPVEVARRLQQQGIHITPANFYSTIPTVDEVLSSFEYQEPQGPYHSPAVFDRDRIAAFVDELDVYAEEFAPPLEGDSDTAAAYYWKNGAFSFADAMAYYCVVRHFRPARILEVGAGFSTLVADHALQRNGNGEIIVVDPFPKAFLRRTRSVAKLVERRVQDIEVRELVEMVEASDLWFIDSTHTVKVGSDCCYLYLKVMPAVGTRVVVHSHDVMLPYAHPIKWPLEKHIYWTEPYLLYAYLLDNPKVRVLFGSHYVQKFLPDRMQRLMRGRYPGGGGSLWYELDPKRAGV